MNIPDASLPCLMVWHIKAVSSAVGGSTVAVAPLLQYNMYECRCILMGNRRYSLVERVIYHAKDRVNTFLFYLNVPT